MTVIYKSSMLYHTVMAVVYHKHRHEHFRAVAEWIPENVSVLDVCCGDGRLCTYLPAVKYAGLDNSAPLVKAGRRRKRNIHLFDLNCDPLPRFDIVVCQVSLFQFYPQVESVLSRLWDATNQRLIVTESVMSLTQSQWPWIASLVVWGTRTNGMTNGNFRFDPGSLEILFEPYANQLRHRSAICGGRDWIYVLDKTCQQQCSQPAAHSLV